MNRYSVFEIARQTNVPMRSDFWLGVVERVNSIYHKSQFARILPTLSDFNDGCPEAGFMPALNGRCPEPPRNENKSNGQNLGILRDATGSHQNGSAL